MLSEDGLIKAVAQGFPKAKAFTDLIQQALGILQKLSSEGSQFSDVNGRYWVELSFDGFGEDCATARGWIAANAEDVMTVLEHPYISQQHDAFRWLADACKKNQSPLAPTILKQIDASIVELQRAVRRLSHFHSTVAGSNSHNWRSVTECAEHVDLSKSEISKSIRRQGSGIVTNGETGKKLRIDLNTLVEYKNRRDELRRIKSIG